MKIWLPYVQVGTGSDVSTQFLANGLRDRGHDVIEQPFARHYEFAPWFLKRAAPPAGCDVIITNTWNGFAFSRAGIPMITVDRLFVLDHTLEPYKSPVQRIYHHTLIRHFVRQSALKAHAVVAVSEYTADALANALRVPRPQVILNAVDTDFFTPPTEPKRLHTPRRLLYVGTLSRRKGTDLLAPIMRSLGDDYTLCYTGNPTAPVLGGNLPANMHALGRLTLEQVREEYRKADALIFPSRGEGLARAVMEAMACGTPVVASDLSSMPEAVDTTVGALCPPDDIEAFCQAIRTLTRHESSWLQHSSQARERAVERFCLSRLLDQFEVLAGLLVAK